MLSLINDYCSIAWEFSWLLLIIWSLETWRSLYNFSFSLLGWRVFSSRQPKMSHALSGTSSGFTLFWAIALVWAFSRQLSLSESIFLNSFLIYFSLKFWTFILCVWVTFLNACQCTCVCNVTRLQKRIVYPRKLELQTVINWHVGVGS